MISRVSGWIPGESLRDFFSPCASRIFGAGIGASILFCSRVGDILCTQVRIVVFGRLGSRESPIVWRDQPAWNRSWTRTVRTSFSSEFRSSTSWGGSCCPRAAFRDMGSILGDVFDVYVGAATIFVRKGWC